MPPNVYVNGRAVSCKAGQGKTIAAFPDVCFSPPTPPAGPVPIPYPNTAMASDTSGGTKKVKISGKEVMQQNKSFFKKSTGDEAATKGLGMGVVTHQIQGKAYFVSGSMNVMVEGIPVCRAQDLTTHNHMSLAPGQTPPMPHMDAVSPPGPPAMGPNPDEVAEIEKGACVCGVAVVELTSGEGDGARAASSVGLLRVVPDGPTTEAVTFEWGGKKVQASKEHGGKAEVTARIALTRPEGDACGEICLTELGKEQQWKATRERTFLVPALTNAEHRLWSYSSKPRSYSVLAKGHDGRTRHLTVEAFPEQQWSVELSAEVHSDAVAKVKRGWEKWGSEVFNLAPIQLNTEIKLPAGMVNGSWGWTEAESWDVFHAIHVEAGLNPILGIGIKVTVSMVKIALSAAGLPPPLPKLMTEHLADIFFTATGGCEARLLGSLEGRSYPSGLHEVDGDMKFAVEGRLDLEATARAGSDYIYSVALNVRAASSVTGSAGFELERDGLFWQPEIEAEPFIGTYAVKTKAFWIFSREEKKGEWKPWKEPYPIWKGKRRTVLPFDANG